MNDHTRISNFNDGCYYYYYKKQTHFIVFCNNKLKRAFRYLDYMLSDGWRGVPRMLYTRTNYYYTLYDYC